jgi:hypothetical protein
MLLFGLAPSNLAAAQQLTSSPWDLRFGAVVFGDSATLPATITNIGTNSTKISAISVSNPQFAVSNMSLPLVLAAGQSVNISVTFTPSAEQWTNGTIGFLTDSSNTVSPLEVDGRGVASDAVVTNPSNLSFGQVAPGKSATLPVVITNTRSWQLTIGSMGTTGDGFSLNIPQLPLTLNSGQSTTLYVTFAPPSTGPALGSLFVARTAAIPLSGVGATAVSGQLSISPSPLNFGDVTLGSTGTQAVTLSASGGSVTVSSAASSSSLFSLSGVSFPFTIGAGASASLNVVFTPQASGTASGSLTFVSNASNSPGPESLNGTGMAQNYSVNLSWNGVQDVMGYNVYRSTTASGKYTKINSSVNPTTLFTDTSVASGQTYYYAATSVNSSGQESARSTPVQAVVP